MRGISFRALIAALIIGVIGLPALAAAQPKAGASCTKKGATAIATNKKFTCVLKGKKLVWNSGVLISVPVAQPTPTPTPTPTQPPVAVKFDFQAVHSTDDGYQKPYQFPCEDEPDLPSELLPIQKYFSNRCPGQMRVAKYVLGQSRPKTQYDSPNLYGSLASCKLAGIEGGSHGASITFTDPMLLTERKRRGFPSPNTVIQLIPFYADDSAPITGTPRDAYGPYLKFISDWIEQASDFGSHVEVRIPDQYLKFSGKLSDYTFSHMNNWKSAETLRFRDALLPAVDPYIDFTGVNMAYVVTTPGTSMKLFSQQPFESMPTREGTFYVAMTAPAHLAADPQTMYSALGRPFSWLHEIFHSGPGFRDHYGDDSRTIKDWPNYGLGQFSLMTPVGGDLTIWEKWLLGFSRDTQIQCVSPNSPSLHWIAPSSVKTQESKAVIIPLTKTKVIVVESIRPSGLYYKHATEAFGVLVYTVDITDTRNGHGYTMIFPDNRTPGTKNDVFLFDGTLKVGESAKADGYKITVVESGTFGDVVRVEKL